MASGSIEGGGSYLHAYIYWSSAKGTGGSTVAADLHAKNVDGAWYQANLYGGYNLTINGNTKSGSGAALSGSANGSVLILSHSVWVGYTGNKSVTISGWIGSNGIYVNGINIGNRDCSGTAKLDMVGSAPSVPTCTAPSTQVFSELGGTITIRWNKPSSYTESGAGYWVDVQINNGAWSNIATINNFNTLSYNYTIPAGQGGTYRFRVGAWNPVGNAGNHGYSGIVTRNSLSPPSIGTLTTFNPYVTSTFTVPLSGGSQANGAGFTRRANVHVDGNYKYAGNAPSSNGNTSVSIPLSASNIINDLGKSSYSSSSRFTVVAWTENSNGTRSSYVSKTFTVNINTDGGATPTLGNSTLSGGILGQAATCFVTGVNSIKVTVPNATLRRAPSGTTVSYKIECTGATVAIGQTATFSGLSAGTKTIKVTAIDSRGLSVASTIQCVVQPWSAPRLIIKSCERVSTNTTTAKLIYSMTYSPIYTYPSVSTQGTQLNSISLQQYNINGGSWNTASNNMIISDLSAERTYTINMRCADKVKTTTYSTASIFVGTEKSLLSLRKTGVGIGCIPNGSYALDVGGATMIRSTLGIRNGSFNTQSTMFTMGYGGRSLDAGLYLSATGALCVGMYDNGAYKGTPVTIPKTGAVSLSTGISTTNITASGTITGSKAIDFTQIEADTVVATKIQATKWEGVFPVGAVYISLTTINPSVYFGGTWVTFGQGRTLVGVNTSDSSFNAVEKTGGEKTHKLTTTEIPSHSHTAYSYTSKNEAGGYGLNTGVAFYDRVMVSGNHTTSSSGGNGSHNNLQPYITVYFWKRTA